MKIVIYGTGYAAQEFISQLEYLKAYSLSPSAKDYKVVGITDSHVTYENVKEYEKKIGRNDIPIFPAQELPKLSSGGGFDYIVVCANEQAKTIFSILQGLLSDIDCVFQVNDFLLNHFVNECDKENDLWEFFRNSPHRLIHKFLHYFRVYDTFFSRFRGKDIVFCEVGVDRGGSLQMWKSYFGPKATIIGVDINPECKQFEEENIIVEIGSQSDPAFWDEFKKKYPKLDILVDDGGHTKEMQAITFECMFPALKDGGIYLCEDVQTSYMKRFDGGYKCDTFIEFSKNFIDDIHMFHSEEEDHMPNYNTFHMRGIHFYDSIVLIEKGMVDFAHIAVRLKNEQGENSD